MSMVPHAVVELYQSMPIGSDSVFTSDSGIKLSQNTRLEPSQNPRWFPLDNQFLALELQLQIYPPSRINREMNYQTVAVIELQWGIRYHTRDALTPLYHVPALFMLFSRVVSEDSINARTVMN